MTIHVEHGTCVEDGMHLIKRVGLRVLVRASGIIHLFTVGNTATRALHNILLSPAGLKLIPARARDDGDWRESVRPQFTSELKI